MSKTTEIGVFVETKTAVVYTFYMVVRTSGGVGPQSDHVRWVGQ